MSETLQRIFDGLGTDHLNMELQRVDEEIERLKDRKVMIERSLGKETLCLFTDNS